ncbi:lipopolysaccharide-induced tumor necrosis factor-alpha factor homolog [Ictalurus furcatus]|uniref:lipopolysaccharide-induced tumor necrosis factor-alpha factor homolog n=1 Tax=Ictalurus furcatus TaxID=66913 RepID=UPI00234FFE9F|nr:lipopolysaccharide-induced tumor necrosis factor-alpha factor homolog [Ictalurus furcatus]
MDFPEATVSAVAFTPPLPSYTEAIQSPQSLTPPPTYGEAVGVPPLQLNNTMSPYPILSIPTEVTPVHQTQQVFAQPSPHQVNPPQLLGGRLGDAPTVIICPHCHHQITTSVLYKPGCAAWGMCCLLTLLGLICGCCLIPCCIQAFQDVHHSCPDCKRFLGTYVR